jgi:transcription initiation factor TFIIE subunit alpha
MDAGFMCPVDGSPMVYYDNGDEKQALQERIDRLKQTTMQ